MNQPNPVYQGQVQQCWCTRCQAGYASNEIHSCELRNATLRNDREYGYVPLDPQRPDANWRGQR